MPLVRRKSGELVWNGTRYAQRLFLAQWRLYCLGEDDGAGEPDASGEADAAGEGFVSLALGLGAGLDSAALGEGEALPSRAGEADTVGLDEGFGLAEAVAVPLAEAVAVPEA
ncbi:MAG TPA: hypothetical protein VJX28_08835 [Chthoniobacterales bacterium]|nr:hypothetical protein [Chthoniobacterales bacterium]